MWVYFVPNVARRLPIERAMSNSFAFGGLNAVIVPRSGLNVTVIANGVATTAIALGTRGTPNLR